MKSKRRPNGPSNRLGPRELVRRPWDRLLWAIEMRSKSCRPEGMFIGDTWHAVTPTKYPGEPLRALLFRTRREAKEWCAQKHEQCEHYGPDWKFRPVRVRETLLPNAASETRGANDQSAGPA